MNSIFYTADKTKRVNGGESSYTHQYVKTVQLKKGNCSLF